MYTQTSAEKVSPLLVTAEVPPVTVAVMSCSVSNTPHRPRPGEEMVAGPRVVVAPLFAHVMVPPLANVETTTDAEP